VLVTAPLVILGARLIFAGWYPTGDNGVIAMKAWDVFHGYTPLRGTYIWEAVRKPYRVHHPGPLEFYFLAPFVMAAGGQPSGVVIGSMVMCAISYAAAVVWAHRAGGLRLALSLLVLCDVVTAIGAPSLPWNPVAAAIPGIPLAVTTYAVLRRHWAALPWVAIAASMAAQPHAVMLPVAGALACGALGYALVTFARLPSQRRAILKAAAMGAAILIAAWLPVFIETLAGAAPNIVQLARYFTDVMPSPGQLGSGYLLMRLPILFPIILRLGILAVHFMSRNGSSSWVGESSRMRRVMLYWPALGAAAALAAVLGTQWEVPGQSQAARALLRAVQAELAASEHAAAPVEVHSIGFSSLIVGKGVIYGLRVAGHDVLWDPDSDDLDYRPVAHAPPGAVLVTLIERPGKCFDSAKPVATVPLRSDAEGISACVSYPN